MRNNNWNDPDVVPVGEEPILLVEDFESNLYVAGYNAMEKTFTDLHRYNFDKVLEVKRWKYINID